MRRFAPAQASRTTSAASTCGASVGSGAAAGTTATPVGVGRLPPEVSTETEPSAGPTLGLVDHDEISGLLDGEVPRCNRRAHLRHESLVSRVTCVTSDWAPVVGSIRVTTVASGSATSRSPPASRTIPSGCCWSSPPEETTSVKVSHRVQAENCTQRRIDHVELAGGVEDEIARRFERDDLGDIGLGPGGGIHLDDPTRGIVDEDPAPRCHNDGARLEAGRHDGFHERVRIHPHEYTCS